MQRRRALPASDAVAQESSAKGIENKRFMVIAAIVMIMVRRFRVTFTCIILPLTCASLAAVRTSYSLSCSSSACSARYTHRTPSACGV